MSGRSTGIGKPAAICALETLPDRVTGVSDRVTLTEVGPAANDTELPVRQSEVYRLVSE
jgi:hypothetical protein